MKASQNFTAHGVSHTLASCTYKACYGRIIQPQDSEKFRESSSALLRILRRWLYLLRQAW